MSNFYLKYYVNQAGTGISGFSGVKFQRGHGFFGKLFSSVVLPVINSFGRKALSKGLDATGDAVAEIGKETASNILNRIKNSQSGKGIKSRSKRKKKPILVTRNIKKRSPRSTKSGNKTKKKVKKKASKNEFFDF